MNTLIFRTACRFIVPLSLIFSVFLYFKGHQTPGGGFVGGLVAAVALIIFRYAYGRQWLERLLPAPERTMIAVGLIFALITGVGALAFGLPFLSSNYGYIPLPSVDGGEEFFEWATVMLFDLGVYLVVAGVMLGMVDALASELDS